MSSLSLKWVGEAGENALSGYTKPAPLATNSILSSSLESVQDPGPQTERLKLSISLP